MSRPIDKQPPSLPLGDRERMDTVLMDDWSDFYASLPDDLVFECSVEVDHDSCGVAVYRDRVVLEQPGNTVPSVVDLEDITSWNVTTDGTDAVVTLGTDARRRTRLPVGYAGAIRVALREVLGTSPQR